MSETGEMELIRGIVKIEFSNLGEGNDGDYDKNDPEDTNLLRFDVSRLEDDEWVAVENASYCTQVPANTPRDILMKLLEALMNEFHDLVCQRTSIRRTAERMSWLNPMDLDLPLRG